MMARDLARLISTPPPPGPRSLLSGFCENDNRGYCCYNYQNKCGFNHSLFLRLVLIVSEYSHGQYF